MRRLHPPILLSALLASCLLAGGCELLYGSEEEEGCTDEFVIYTVRVVDEQGEPIDGIALTVKNAETGRVYSEFNVPEKSRSGVYTIFTDAFMGEISRSGARVTITGKKGDLHFSETFIFKSGRCHVEKLAGPDIITLEEETASVLGE